MRFAFVALASFALVCAAPVGRSIVTNVVDLTPDNKEELQISDITGDCSGNACQVAQEVGPHAVHEIVQHAGGSQAGVITHAAAYGIDAGTYGAGAELADTVREDGQHISEHFGGVPTCDDSHSNHGQCRRSRIRQYADAVRPVLSGLAAGGQDVQDVTTEANDGGDGQGPTAFAETAGRVFTGEADWFLQNGADVGEGVGPTYLDKALNPLGP